MEVAFPGKRAHVDHERRWMAFAARDSIEPLFQLWVRVTVAVHMPADRVQDCVLVKRPNQKCSAFTEMLHQRACKLEIWKRIDDIDPLRVLQWSASLPDRMAAPLKGDQLIRAHTRVVRHRHTGGLEIDEVKRVLQLFQSLFQRRIEILAARKGIFALHSLSDSRW